MVTFLKKVTVTLALFAAGILLITVLVHLMVRKQANFRLDAGDRYLVVGHSHPECAFNDELIDGLRNLGKSGESYFYTYNKVKQILPQKQVEAVFIEYSNNQIQSEMDEWTWGYSQMNSNLAKYAPFMEWDEWRLLWQNNRKDLPKVISTSVRHNITRLIGRDLSLSKRYGEYNRLDRNKVEAHIARIETSENKDDRYLELSIDNIEYLGKLIDYCRAQRVEVYLIRSPQHPKFPRKNEEILMRIKEDRFAELEFLDFDHFPLKNTEYGDLGHLNYRGAEIFSRWFDEQLKEGMLEKENKSQFVAGKLNKLR